MARRLVPVLRLVAALLACQQLAQLHGALAQLVIKRNSDDCAYPANMAGITYFPNANYFIKGTGSMKITPAGSFLIDSDAGFSVEYFGTYKIVTNKLQNEKYLLYQCGTARPRLPSGVRKAFEIPLRSVAADDATAADALNQLVLMDRCAFASELAVANCLQAIVACGYAAPDPHTGGKPLADISPGVDAFHTWGASTNTKTIAYNAPSGKTPLLRAEWMKFMSVFYNKEIQANTLVNRIRTVYNDVRRAALAVADGSIAVCWTFVDWDNDYGLSYADYKVAYIQDAGGTMFKPSDLLAAGMVAKGSGYVFKAATPDVGALWGGVLNECNVIIDESYDQATGGLVSMDQFLDMHDIKPYASQIEVVRNQQVYTIAGTTGQPITNPNSGQLGSIGLEWFERAVHRCDEVIRDFASVITPRAQSSYLSSWSRRWLLRLDGVDSQKRVPAVCTLASAKLNSLCQRVTYAVRICPNQVWDCAAGKATWPPVSQRCDYVSQQKKVMRERKKGGVKPSCAGTSV